MSSFFRGKHFLCWNVSLISLISLTVVSSALTVLLLECSTALTVGDKCFCWEDSHWFMNSATNRKDPSKQVCLLQSEMCCNLKAGQSELRRQQSEISKRHLKTTSLPSNKIRHFWNSYLTCCFINRCLKKILRSFKFWVDTPFNWMSTAQYPHLESDHENCQACPDNHGKIYLK